MKTADPAPQRAAPPRRFQGQAFGIDVDSGFSVPDLPAERASGSNPSTSLSLASHDELKREWPERRAERLVERTFPDGSPMMVVEQHDDVGFHVWAPRVGRYLVREDGTSVKCAVPKVTAWRWERLLFAQVLPLAAALRGRELFHSSAVAVDDSAIAFVGLSGAGKSSIAAHLVARGASLVTDDVLALERTQFGVLAHPGTGLAGLDTRELAAMSAEGRARVGTRVGKADKVYLAVPVAEEPLPLRALYFIVRKAGGPIAVEERSSDASLLLGSSFIAYLRSARYLVDHLEMCAWIAGEVPVFEISVPPTARATDVAAQVEGHAHALLGASP